MRVPIAGNWETASTIHMVRGRLLRNRRLSDDGGSLAKRMPPLTTMFLAHTRTAMSRAMLKKVVWKICQGPVMVMMPRVSALKPLKASKQAKRGQNEPAHDRHAQKVKILQPGGET